MAQEDPKELPPDLWSALQEIRAERICSKGKVLFQSGERPLGVYLVEEGQVRLCLPSVDCERFFEMASPGAILALSEALTGEPHKLTARTVGQTQVALIRRPDLLEFLKDHSNYCMQIVRWLSEDLHILYRRFFVASGATARSRKSAGKKPAEAGSARED